MPLRYFLLILQSVTINIPAILHESVGVFMCNNNRTEGGNMSILQKTYLASVGIYNLSRKKAEEIIDSLIKAGEINSSERQQAILELLEKTEKSAGRMASKLKKETGQLQKDIDRKVSKFKLATKKDLEKLSKKIDQLAKALDKKK